LAIKRLRADGSMFESETMYSNFNVLEEGAIFQINPKWPSISQTKYIGKHKTPVIIIDDFLLNVDKVRELALSVPYSNEPQKMHASPGCRFVSHIRWDLHKVVKSFYSHWIYENFNYQCKFEGKKSDLFTFTIIDTAEPLDVHQVYPHVDLDYDDGEYLGGNHASHVAALVYLNKPEECVGGTAIYKHKKIKSHLVKSRKDYDLMRKYEKEMNKNPIHHRDTNINDDPHKYYELSELVEMKYNRLVLYPTFLFHHPFYSPNDFNTPNCRIAINAFI